MEPTTVQPSNSIIKIAHQLHSFVETTDRTQDLTREAGITALFITSKYPRPPEPAATRSGDSLSLYPRVWETDIATLRRAVKAFSDRTVALRATPDCIHFFRRYEPADVRRTPGHTPPGSPIPELVYERPIGPNLPFTMNEDAIRRIVNDSVSAAMEQVVSRLATTTTPPMTPIVPVAPSKWMANDLGFFDPNYDDKTVHTAAAIEHAGKDTFFRDVHLFLDRAKQLGATKGFKAVRDNLWLSLRGNALSWWTSELSDDQRRLATYGENLDEWSKQLVKRFKQPSFVAMESLLKESYTMRDAAAKREPRDFAQRMLRTAKDAGINDILPQLDMIYTNIDLSLRMFLVRPTEKSTIDTFLSELDDRKYEWWAYAARRVDRPDNKALHRPNQPHRPMQQNQGQYASFRPQQASGGSVPYRPPMVGQQYGYGNRLPFQSDRPPFPSRPYSAPAPYRANAPFQSNAPYQRPFQSNVPYQSNVNTQQQQSRPYQPPQQPQPQQAFGRPNANANQYGQRPFTSQNQAQGQRTGDYNRNPYRKPFNAAKAYYGDAPSDDQENTSPDDQDVYQQYEDDFYDSYHRDATYEDVWANEAPAESFNEPEEPDDTVEAHFMASPKASPKPKATCRHCHAKFASNNKLHQHLLHCQKPPVNMKPVDAFSIQIIESDATDKPVPGKAFRGYRFATVKVSITYQGTLYEYCFDTGCTMSLIDRAFLNQIIKEGGISGTIEIKRMPSPIKVRGIGTKEHDACEYAVIPMYIPGPDGKVALIRREIHIVDELSAKALIGIDIMKPEGIVLDTNKDLAIIGSCQSLQVPMSMAAKGPRTNVSVVSKAKYAVPAHSFMTIPIKPVTLPDDRDLIFEPEQLDDLTLSAHIVDHNLSHLMVRNDTDLPVTLSRHARLGQVLEYEAEGCFQVDSTHAPLAERPAKKSQWSIRQSLRALLGMTAAFNAATAPSISAAAATIPTSISATAPTSVSTIMATPAVACETIHATGATIYGNAPATNAISNVVEAYPSLWKDTGNVVNIPEDQYMEIPLVDNWQDLYKAGQARVYPVGTRDKDAIDEAFNKLHDQGRMEWTTSATPFTFPCFVVWKETPDGPKGRVVVDIRALNKITVPDAYPVPSQTEILSLLMHCTHISTIDAASFFYQWWVKWKHRYRLTVSSHRGQETFLVPVMGFRNSPAYVQRMIDRILRPFRSFCRAYVDDIVIFSTSLQEHIRHLNLVFGALSEMNIHLAPHKAYLGYPSVHLLGQRVDALGLATAEDKLAAIRNIEFPRTLAALERYLGMTGYLKQYVPYYSAIVKPLQERKTLLNRQCKHTTGSAHKSEAGRSHLHMPTPKELNAYHQLQSIFASPTMLHHHDPSRQLYIDLDASKEFGFGAHVYHVKQDDPRLQKGSAEQSTLSEPSTLTRPLKPLSEPKGPLKPSADDTPKQKSMQPILFLSRQLTSAETRYWPTELEVAGLVWVVKKIRHLIEASVKVTIIYTDHSATLGIVRQSSLNTTSIEKLNLRLVRASEYLQRFRIEVRHKAGRNNIVPDALSRLASRASYRSEESVLDTIDAYPVSLITVSDAFRKRLYEGYNNEPRWTRIINMVKANDDLGDNAAALPYKMVDGLLYFDDDEKGLRLCIPSSMEKEVFQLAHDELGHPGYARTHERLTEGLHLHNMSTKLHDFIRHCPQCQHNQTPRHKPYGSLQPIFCPARPFHTLTIDFILALPKSLASEDCVMSVTDKFSKAVTFIPGQITYSSKDWAIRLLDRLAQLNWGLPRAIISDRDRKFVGELWREIFLALKVDLLYSTAWHPQTDGMSERSNQTAEIALRYYIATLDDIREWPKILPRMSAALNNSVKYSSTALAPTQVMYGFRTREALDLLRSEDNADPPHSPDESNKDLVAVHPATTRGAARRIEHELQETSIPPNDRLQEASTPNAPIRRPNPVVKPSRPSKPLAVASMHEYRPAHIDAKDAIAFAAMRMKAHYDTRHQPRFFNVGDSVNLRLHKGYHIPALVGLKKIGPQLVGPFKVIERIGRLAYRLQLPDNMRIHPVISIAHLEPSTDPALDPYYRHRSPPPAVTVEGEIEYEIDRLVRKRRVRKGKGWSIQYLIRWKGFGPEHDTWQPERDVMDTVALDEYERRYGTTSGIAMTVSTKRHYRYPYFRSALYHMYVSRTIVT